MWLSFAFLIIRLKARVTTAVQAARELKNQGAGATDYSHIGPAGNIGNIGNGYNHPAVQPLGRNHLDGSWIWYLLCIPSLETHTPDPQYISTSDN